MTEGSNANNLDQLENVLQSKNRLLRLVLGSLVPVLAGGETSVLVGLALTELVWTPTSTFPVLTLTLLVLVLTFLVLLLLFLVLTLPPLLLPFWFTFLVLVCVGSELVLVFLTTLVVPPPLLRSTLPGGVVTAGGGGALPLLGDG